jgi:hypothetical protein
MFPLPSILISCLYFGGKKVTKSRRITALIMLFFSVTYLCFFKNFSLSDIRLFSFFWELVKNFFFLEDYKKPILSWVSSSNILSYALSSLILGLGFILLPNTLGEVEKRAERHFRHRHRLAKSLPFDFLSSEHILATGTTGSGKTANILQYIEKSIISGEFVAIIDGKGGLQQFDLYTVVKQLARNHGRKIRVLNQSNLDDLSAAPYNPFSGLTATQIKDFLLNMSDWESDHYKNLAGRYWQFLASLLLSQGFNVTFDTLTTLSNPSEFSIFCSKLLQNGAIDEKTFSTAQKFFDGE